MDSELRSMDMMQERLVSQYNALSVQKSEDKEKFLEIKSGVAPEKMNAVHAERAIIRPERRKKLLEHLQKIYQQQYEYDTFKMLTQW